MSDEKSIDALLRELAVQILEAALDSDNPQYKVDAFKAIQGYGKASAKSAPAEPTSGMAAWGARLRQVQRVAEEVNGDGVDDDEATSDRG